MITFARQFAVKQHQAARQDLDGSLLGHPDLAYYDFDCLSTGPLEGTNNKIKTMQRTAYGFRDKELLKLKIKAPHESKYALVG